MRDLKRLEDITVSKPEDELDFETIEPAAVRMGIDPYLMLAVVRQEVGARQDGFSEEGKAIINYERHQFSELTAHQYDHKYPSISNPRFYFPKKNEDHPYNCTQSERWGLLLFAASIDYEAAVQATSFGLFQIMGFNYHLCGCDSPAQFVDAMHISEQRQFQVWLTFIKEFDCLEPLQRGDTLAFAIRYNTGRNWRIAENYNKPKAAAQKYANELRVKYDNLKPRSVA